MFHERMGPMLPSKMVTKRQRTALALKAAVTDGAESATAALEAELREVLRPDETLPDLRFLQELLGRRLERLATGIVEADEGVKGDSNETAELRKQLTEAAKALHLAVFKLRSLVNGLYGPDAASTLLGLGPRLPRDPVAIHRLAIRALDRVAQPDFQTPDAGTDEPAMNLAAIVAQRIAAPAAELERSLQESSLEQKAAQRRFLAKRGRMDEFDQGYRRTARFLKALYALGGLDAMASKVRPSARRAPAPDPTGGKATEDLPSPVT